MSGKILALAITAFLFGAGGLHANEKKNWPSPDGVLIAHAENRKANGSADYTDWDVVTIRDRRGDLLASLSLEEGSGVSRAVVTTAAWSTDGRFFVFATTSSGGHSSWHMPSYVYDASTSCIYSIDDSIGDTTDDNPQFELSKSDVLKVRFWDGTKAEEEAAPRMIDLRDFVKKGPKLALNSQCYASHHR
jgi:hypothetical protein